MPDMEHMMPMEPPTLTAAMPTEQLLVMVTPTEMLTVMLMALETDQKKLEALEFWQPWSHFYSLWFCPSNAPVLRSPLADQLEDVCRNISQLGTFFFYFI